MKNKKRDFVEVEGEYLTDNSSKEIKFIEEDDNKNNDNYFFNKDIQTLIYIGKEINFDYEKIPMYRI
jgi:hypothetical protein